MKFTTAAALLLQTSLPKTCLLRLMEPRAQLLSLLKSMIQSWEDKVLAPGPLIKTMDSQFSMEKSLMFLNSRLQVIKAYADGHFNDVSADIDGDLVLMARTTTPDYAGFRITIVSGAVSSAYSCSNGGGLPFSGGCYKANFSLKNTDSEDF